MIQVTNGWFLEFLKIRAKWRSSELPCYFSDFTCFWPFLTKTVITWDVLIQSELVNIRWKANKHSYNLGVSGKFLNGEILDIFGKIPLERNTNLIGNIYEKPIYLIFRITYWPIIN